MYLQKACIRFGRFTMNGFNIKWLAICVDTYALANGMPHLFINNGFSLKIGMVGRSDHWRAGDLFKA